jgi:hypothetical protein
MASTVRGRPGHGDTTWAEHAARKATAQGGDPEEWHKLVMAVPEADRKAKCADLQKNPVKASPKKSFTVEKTDAASEFAPTAGAGLTEAELAGRKKYNASFRGKQAERVFRAIAEMGEPFDTVTKGEMEEAHGGILDSIFDDADTNADGVVTNREWHEHLYTTMESDNAEEAGLGDAWWHTAALMTSRRPHPA